MMNKAWVNLPYNFCMLLRLCIHFRDQVSRVLTYLVHFDSVSCMVSFFRFQMKLMKVGLVERGTSFEASHEISRVSEMQSMSSKL